METNIPTTRQNARRFKSVNIIRLDSKSLDDVLDGILLLAKGVQKNQKKIKRIGKEVNRMLEVIAHQQYQIDDLRSKVYGTMRLEKSIAACENASPETD